MDKDIAYCDGASRKDGRGGWGYVVMRGPSVVRAACGGDTGTTNNRMELMGAIMALRSYQRGAEVTIVSDSKYVVDGILDHADLWLKTNWRTSSNQPVKNRDLWETLIRLDVDRVVDWQWVKGHSGDPGNERADKLASIGIPDES